MNRLPVHTFLRRAALPLLAALVATAATPVPPVTASPPRPPGSGMAATAVGHPRLVDLGPLDTVAGGDIRPTGFLNNKGQLAARIGNRTDGYSRAALLAEGTVIDVHARLGLGENSSSAALGVNDDGVVVGDYSERTPGRPPADGNAFILGDGAATTLPLRAARDVNNAGQVVGDNWVYDRSDGSTLRIDGSLKADAVHATAVNNRGQVSGVFRNYSDPAGGRTTAFRTDPGLPVDVDENLLTYLKDRSSVVYDINDRGEKGQAAGFGTDEGGGFVPVIWQENGTPTAMKTRHGGKVLAINNAGIGAGWLYHVAPGGVYADEHAAVYLDGQGTDLNTLLPADTAFTLIQATGINDVGQIGGFMQAKAGGKIHAFLLDLGGRPSIASLTLQTQKYPSAEWIPVPPDGTFDGNQVRVTVSITNPGSTPASAQLVLTEERSGRFLPGGMFEEIIPPYGTVTKRVVWDTEGFAWLKGRARSDRVVVAKLRAGGAELDGRTAPLLIRPKPVILVHGFKTDAKTAWGDYASILASGHPLLRGFAVGDGQVPGKLSLGDPSDPYQPTLNYGRNGHELGVYIRGVLEKTGASRVDLLTHSLGGLVARVFLHKYDVQNPLDGKPSVNRLLQMGVPNLGTPCADLVMDRMAGRSPDDRMPFWPALLYMSEAAAREFNKEITDLSGVPVSTLTGWNHKVKCPSLGGDGGPTELDIDSDSLVPGWSANFSYDDNPETATAHAEMTRSPGDFLAYVQPRLASRLADVGNPSGELPEPQDPEDLKRAKERDAAEPEGVRSGTNGVKAGKDVTAEAAAGVVSTFATPSVTVKAGETASVPLQVPAGTGFGVVGMLPPTVGMLLRDPSGKAAASYPAGSTEAAQPIQGLSVAEPQAGAWKVEVTNTGTGPVTAYLSAWVAGNPLTVTAAAEQAGDDGRVRVSATVTENGAPVTGIPVKAVLVAEDATRRELTLADDGKSGDGAAGDGKYAATSEALADGAYGIGVRAEIAQGDRTTRAAVRVAKPDLREFALTLSAQPGGSVEASPKQERYRSGTKVTLTARAESGRIPIGWTVDGRDRPAGNLTITMDEEHTVVARFGSYTVTELGAPPGADPAGTWATALNDRGQVAATVTDKDGRKHAVRWQAGAFTDLGGLPCTDGGLVCQAEATGINAAGEVSGVAVASTGRGNERHAVVFRADGTVRDLQPAETAAGTTSRAADLNDSGQVFGWMGVPYARNPHVVWEDGTAVRLPEPEFTDRDISHTRLQVGRINNRGQVAGAYVTERGLEGLPLAWQPALYRDGKPTRLSVTGCASPRGTAFAVNDAGTAAGYLDCGINGSEPPRAAVWQDGKRIELGPGRASAINHSGLVAGMIAQASPDRYWAPALWLDGTAHRLADLLPRPLCPDDDDATTAPCMGVYDVVDVNAAGQVLVRGFVRDHSTTSAGLSEAARSFLLTPTTARADLEVAHTVSPAEPGPGATVTWTATVTNKGGDAATDVRLDVLVPPGVTGAACDTWRGVCTPVKEGFRNTVRVLEPGWSATVKVTATVPAGTADGTRLTARAGAASLAVPDPEPGDNSVAATATVRPWLDKTGIKWADEVKVGQESSEKAVTLTNRLNAPITLKAITVTGPFKQTNGCGTELAVGGRCTVQVRFAPTQAGDASGTLTFATGTDGGGPVHTVTLEGTGTTNAAPAVQAPASLTGVVGKEVTLKVSFTDADAADTHTALVAWGDGPPDTPRVTRTEGGGTFTVTHTYAQARTGTVMVMVTDSARSTSTVYIPYEIKEAGANQAPKVTLWGPATVAQGATWVGRGSFTDPGSTSWTVSADYGDGAGPRPLTQTAGQWKLERAFTAAGTYTVTLAVTDNQGATGTATAKVQVTNTVRR
ncbi:putative repeat protein (TIGR01451 family) [Streptosporangium becharense]|uniref:Putative repeat protein (TIGR01451 family) n=1 Tax=Streptosporangium becharense TaxID=1816182 RepID=A0A7W9MEW3_9ACTN|nr:choice-of-anchor D domain-containing protein [Streptosporangium becharense]MBB2913805.1 putative repeat protein (TIGR01451 family) [Streptosporangium becharense]MBB5817886.1 putative repeat protein (TIGR01451 family) [Streptosporangium becharense]